MGKLSEQSGVGRPSWWAGSGWVTKMETEARGEDYREDGQTDTLAASRALPLPALRSQWTRKPLGKQGSARSSSAGRSPAPGTRRGRQGLDGF